MLAALGVVVSYGEGFKPSQVCCQKYLVFECILQTQKCWELFGRKIAYSPSYWARVLWVCQFLLCELSVHVFKFFTFGLCCTVKFGY